MPPNPYQSPDERGAHEKRRTWNWGKTVLGTGIAAIALGFAGVCLAYYLMVPARPPTIQLRLAQFAVLLCSCVCALGIPTAIIGGVAWLLTRD